jgi:hypothetical protein
MQISLRSTNHSFEKINLVTVMGKGRSWDVYRCSLCGLIAKMYSFGVLTVDNRYKNKALNCPKTTAPSKIRITKCNAVGRVFGNLQPKSIHDVIDPPEGKNNSGGVWVMGVGEPVKVLFEEFEIVE